MAVLVHLAESNGAVVSRNALLDAVWPRMAVTPDSLSQCLVELRRAFGDDSKNPKTIETIRKIGVRLVPPVTVEDIGGPRPQRWKSWRVAAGAAAVLVVVGAAGVILLVGPKEPPTDNARAYEFFLSGNEYLKRDNDPNHVLPVIVQQYTRATEEDPDFALAWARLAIAHTALHFRGIDRTSERLALADAAVSRALELAPALPEAHLARAAFLGRGLGDYDGALAELAAAEPEMRQDAEFYYLRAGLYMHKGEVQLAIADHDKLLELDPRNVVYLRQRYNVEHARRDYAAAERTLNRIIELAPDEGTAYVDQVALALCADGDTALANSFEQATPSANYGTALASTYVRWLAALFDRDYGRALNVLDRSSEEPVFDGDFRNSFTPKSLLYARTHLLAGNRAEAMRHFEQAKTAIELQLAGQQGERQAPTSLHVAFAEIGAALGDHEGARASLARAAPPTSAMQRSAMRFAVATRVLVPLGQHEPALRELDAYLSGPGGCTIERLLADPQLDPVRNEPEFAALVAKHQSRQ
jgi:tetratricopeptide (TPR) repeat protein